MDKFRLELSHLRKAYQRSVLQDVNLEANNSSYLAIIGKSGSGKSTLLNILGLLESYDAGEYRFNGQLIRNSIDYAGLRLHNIGFIFQAYNLIPTLSCRENILLPTLYARTAPRQDLNELANLLNIVPLLEQNVATLSGGEKQRVAIARALILDPCLILADEPTGNLDAKNREVIFRLLRHEHQKGRGIILITHDVQATSEADTVFKLTDGVLEKLSSIPLLPTGLVK